MTARHLQRHPLVVITAWTSLFVATAGSRLQPAAAQPPVTAVLRNATLFNQAIDAMSMRHWNPALNGHDHFFATFGKFGPPSDKTGDMIAEVVARAAAERISYLELMLTPDGGAAAQRGRAAGWDPDFGRQRDRLLAGGFE